MKVDQGEHFTVWAKDEAIPGVQHSLEALVAQQPARNVRLERAFVYNRMTVLFSSFIDEVKKLK